MDVQYFIEWLSENPTKGAFYLIIVYILATMLMVPVSMLSVGTGYAFTKASGSVLYGMLIGCTVSQIGASIGAIFTHYISRYMLRKILQEYWKNNKRFIAIDRVISNNGFRIAVLLRVSPIIPFTMLNYVLGATSISTRDNLLSLLGFFPDALVYVYLGSSVDSIADISSGFSL